jgi:signal recognition particle GTPase
MEEEMCLVDSSTTNSIVRKIKYFQTLKKLNGNILTIVGRDAVIIGTGRCHIFLPIGT